jgi:hypothetical protein
VRTYTSSIIKIFFDHVISFIVAGLGLENAGNWAADSLSFPERALERLGSPAEIRRTCCEYFFVPLGRRNRIRIAAPAVIEEQNA